MYVISKCYATKKMIQKNQQAVTAEKRGGGGVGGFLGWRE